MAEAAGAAMDEDALAGLSMVEPSTLAAPRQIVTFNVDHVTACADDAGIIPAPSAKLALVHIALVVIDVPVLGALLLAWRFLVDGGVVGMRKTRGLALLTPLSDSPAWLLSD
jgi:hypothetical protein